MFYVTESGRVLAHSKFLNNEKYIEVLEYPDAPKIDGKIGYVSGIDVDNNAVLFAYRDIVEDVQQEVQQEEIEDITKKDIIKIQSTLDYLAMMAE